MDNYENYKELGLYDNYPEEIELEDFLENDNISLELREKAQKGELTI